MTSSNEEVGFVAIFNEGYSLRSVIEFLKITNTDGNFVFEKDRITYNRNNGSNTVLNFITIRTCDIQYKFNAENETITVGTDLADLAKITKAASKRDSFKMSRKMGKNEKVVIKHTSPNSQSSTSYLNSKNIEPEEYVVDFETPEDEPNCTIPISEFCKACSAVSSSKATSVRILGFQKGGVIEGLGSNSEVVKSQSFGSPDINEDGDKNVNSSKTLSLENDSEDVDYAEQENFICTIYIDGNTLKGLAKSNNIPPSGGCVKFYMAPDVIKLIIPIGGYGSLTTYIRSLPTGNE